MARATFGNGIADFVTQTIGGGLQKVVPANLTFWSAKTGGTQYADLLLGGSPVASIAVGTDGQVPQFQGPNGVFTMWADGGGARVQIVAVADAVAQATAPTDTSVATAIGTPGSATAAALSASIAAKVERGKCHVVVCAGQSNATQQDAAIPYAAPDVRLTYWNGTTVSIVPSTDSYLLPAFMREYAKTLPAGDWVLGVQCAVSSTGFTTTSLASPPAGYATAAGGTWDRTLVSDPISLYANMISKTLAAVTAAKALTNATVSIDALLWSQGESDTPRLSEGAYAAKIDDLIAQARTDLSVPLLPAILGSMTPEYAEARGQTYTADVAAALSDTPRRRSVTAFVYGPREQLQPATPIHYSTQGQIMRGKMFADALMRARVNLTATHPMPPTGLRIERTQAGDAVLAWEPAFCRVVSYNAEFSVDGGTSWFPGAIFKDSRLRASTYVYPGEPIRARVSVTSEYGTSTYAETIELPAVSATAPPTVPAPTWILGQAVPAGLVGAGTLYTAATLPSAGGTLVSNMRNADSSRALFVNATQASAQDYAASTTASGGSGNNSFGAPLAKQGDRVSVVSLSPDGATLKYRRNLEAVQTDVNTAGATEYTTYASAATGGVVLRNAWFFNAAHDEATMTAVQRALARAGGLDIK